MMDKPSTNRQFVLGSCYQAAAYKHIIFLEMNTKMDDKYLLDNKLDYLKLTLKISKLRYHGDKPPEELLQEAYEIGRLAGISEIELKRTCSSL
jgi:hypothetical protein